MQIGSTLQIEAWRRSTCKALRPKLLRWKLLSGERMVIAPNTKQSVLLINRTLYWNMITHIKQSSSQTRRPARLSLADKDFITSTTPTLSGCLLRRKNQKCRKQFSTTECCTMTKALQLLCILFWFFWTQNKHTLPHVLRANCFVCRFDYGRITTKAAIEIITNLWNIQNSLGPKY